MTKIRRARCKKKKDKKNLEVLEPLNDKKLEEVIKGVNKEVTKEKMLNLRIVCEKNSNEKLTTKFAIETE